MESAIDVYKLITVITILASRYLFQDGMVDCVMDGIQNVTQLDRTYREKVLNHCGLFGIPPNYVKLESKRHNPSQAFMRIEPRNQTFVYSIDYFLAKEEVRFNFRFIGLLLSPVILLQVRFIVMF